MPQGSTRSKAVKEQGSPNTFHNVCGKRLGFCASMQARILRLPLAHRVRGARVVGVVRLRQPVEVVELDQVGRGVVVAAQEEGVVGNRDAVLRLEQRAHGGVVDGAREETRVDATLAAAARAAVAASLSGGIAPGISGSVSELPVGAAAEEEAAAPPDPGVSSVSGSSASAPPAYPSAPVERM